MDFGVLTTGIGTLIGAIVAGLTAWKVAQKESKETELGIETLELTRDKEHYQEQKEWREELKLENDKLRELAAAEGVMLRDRSEKKQATIEKLLDERMAMKQLLAEQAITLLEQATKLKEYESMTSKLRQEMKNEPSNSSQQSVAQAAPDSSNINQPK